jgi:hypothetical protein
MVRDRARRAKANSYETRGDKAAVRSNYQKFLDLWKNADPGLPEVADAKKRMGAL